MITPAESWAAHASKVQTTPQARTAAVWRRNLRLAQVSGLAWGMLLAFHLLSVAPVAGQTPSGPRPGGPPAPAVDPDHAARGHFERGRSAYEAGEYRDAWAEFHEAYQLSNRPELLFNIGQTADRLGQDADAIKAFNLYLKRLPDAQNRRDVENRVRALRERLDKSTSAGPAAPPGGEPQGDLDPEPTREPLQPKAASRTPERAWPTSEPESAPPPPAAREYRRGLYLRLAGGLGLRSDSISNEYAGDFSLFGFGLALDIAAGYAVLPGFVVGGGVFLDWTSSPTLSNEYDDEVTLGHANLTTIGPFLDWYLKRQTLGLHIQGGLGLGILSYAARGDAAGSGTATGISFMLGAGYEFRLAGAFALGVLLRVTAAALTEDSDAHGIFSPSLLMSFTWF
ncbi:MAG: hypothetical protein ABW321_06010 [Polyangiales bacterium]